MPFKVTDRAKAAVSLIGTATDRHLTWSRGSLLSHMTGDETISSSLAEAGRAAKAALETRRNERLTSSTKLHAQRRRPRGQLGVKVATAYKAQLDC